MDTKNLEAFVKTAELKSVTLSAKQLHLTQPAISKRLAALEEQLNTKLFTRRGLNLHLTPAGTVLLPFAKQVIHTIESGRDALFSYSQGKINPLNLGVGYFPGIQQFPLLLKKFVENYTNLELSIKYLLPTNTLAALSFDEIEFCINEITADISDDYIKHKVWSYPLNFAVHKNHLLASQKTLSLEALSEFPAILPEPLMPIRASIEELFRSHKLKLNVGYQVNIMLVIEKLLNEKVGWGILPSELIKKNLVVISPISTPLNMDIYIIHKKDKVLSTSSKKFIELLLSSSKN